jgi:hypothetical protein
MVFLSTTNDMTPGCRRLRGDTVKVWGRLKESDLETSKGILKHRDMVKWQLAKYVRWDLFTFNHYMHLHLHLLQRQAREQNISVGKAYAFMTRYAKAKRCRVYPYSCAVVPFQHHPNVHIHVYVVVSLFSNPPPDDSTSS